LTIRIADLPHEEGSKLKFKELSRELSKVLSEFEDKKLPSKIILYLYSEVF
jgi:hypothetical protein